MSRTATVATVAIAAHPHPMTAEEFLALPETDALKGAQLIDGELVLNSPSLRHQRIVVWFAHLHLTFAQDHPDAGEMGIEIDAHLDDRNVYQPDLWWVPADHRFADTFRRFEQVPPLVVEVRSPSTWRHDIGTKLRHYEQAGVAEVWLVDTAADVVLVFRRSSPDAQHLDVSLEVGVGDDLTTPLIPGWVIDVAKVFDR